jgi:hypothetical protein
MVKRPADKTVTDYFISGKEIDAAVRRAVREAVAPKPAAVKAKKKVAAARKTSARRRAD